MRLVYTADQSQVKKGQEVKVDDTVRIREDLYKVTYFRPPHKPSSAGKVSLRLLGGSITEEVYVTVIGAEWIEREDREEEETVRTVVHKAGRNQVRRYTLTQDRAEDQLVTENLSFQELLDKTDFSDIEVDVLMDLQVGQHLHIDMDSPTSYLITRTN